MKRFVVTGRYLQLGVVVALVDLLEGKLLFPLRVQYALNGSARPTRSRLLLVVQNLFPLLHLLLDSLHAPQR